LIFYSHYVVLYQFGYVKLWSKECLYINFIDFMGIIASYLYDFYVIFVQEYVITFKDYSNDIINYLFFNFYDNLITLILLFHLQVY